MTVEQILNEKGWISHTLPPETPLRVFAALLVEKNIGAMICTDASGGIIGIMSERDLARAVGRFADRALDMSVSDIMTRDVVACSVTDSVDDLLTIMLETRCRHLPVVQEGRLIGMISIGDLVKAKLG